MVRKVIKLLVQLLVHLYNFNQNRMIFSDITGLIATLHTTPGESLVQFTRTHM